MNKYYTAMEVFKVLTPVGSKLSNTWVGSSRVIDTIYAETDVLPGEELHDLVGGLFHVDSEGVAWRVRLTYPPHVFEAHYHRNAESDRLTHLLKQEFLCIEEDPVKVDSYAG